MKLVLGNIIYNRKNKSALRKLKIALKLVFILVKIDLDSQQTEGYPQ